jgi:hypothetical protein
MSSKYAAFFPMQQGPSPLLLPQRASSPAMSPQPATSVVASCQIPPAVDPLVLEHLTVWDPESGGNRHWDEKTQTLHIVQTEAVDRVRITYTGPNIPAKLSVTRNGDTLPALAGSGDWTAEVTYATAIDPYGDGPMGLTSFPRLFTKKSAICTYVFSAPQFKVTVKLYNPDQWKLTVAVPPMKSQSLGRARNFGGKASAYTASSTGWSVKDSQIVAQSTKSNVTRADDGKAAVASKETGTTRIGKGGMTTTREAVQRGYAARSTKLVDVGFKDGQYVVTNKGKGKPQTETNRTPKKKDSGDVAIAVIQLFTLERNGLAITFDGLKSIEGVLDLTKKIRGLFKALKNSVPQVGWTWDLDFKVFEGSLELGWGWREAKGSGVSYAMTLEASLVLIEATGSLGVGVSSGGPGSSLSASAKLVGELSGSIAAKAGPLEFIIDGVKEDKGAFDLLTATGEVKVALKFTVETGDVFRVVGGAKATLLSVEAVVKAGGDQGMAVEIEGKAGGIEIFYEVKVFGIPKKKKLTVMDPVKLGKFTLPGPGDTSSGEYTTRDQVKDKAESLLSEGWFPLSFYENVTTVEYRREYLLFGDKKAYKDTVEEDVPTTKVADLIATKIWARKDRLDLDAKVIEGIILALKDRFSADDKDVSLDVVLKELNSADFANLLTRAECPVKCCLIDNGLTQ